MNPSAITLGLRSADGATLAAVAPELGGIVSSLSLSCDDAPRETLFRHAHFFDADSSETRGGIPFLFPVCGRSCSGSRLGAWRFMGAEYPMPIHGFAMRRPWSVAEASATRAVLALADDDVTRAMYPFSFALRMVVEARNDGLRISVRIANAGDRAMPYACGFHPYFKARRGAIAEFDAVSRRSYDATFCALTGEVQAPMAPCRLDDPLVNGCIHDLGAARAARLVGADGDGIDLRFGGEPAGEFFRYLQLYRPDGADFACVEPWSRPASALSDPDRCRLLDPGATDEAWIHLRAVPRGGLSR